VTYRVELRPAAARALRKLDKPVQQRIRGVLALLAEQPRPPASTPLVGRPAWRVRTGVYRIIYTIDDGTLVVAVIALGHRREVYHG
jgi:mRNA interferase RelE/StbE